MENIDTGTDVVMELDASTTVDNDAAGLFIHPDMSVGVCLPQTYSDGDILLPPHVRRIFELSLCITSSDHDDQKRFWTLVEEIAKKRVREQQTSSS